MRKDFRIFYCKRSVYFAMSAKELWSVCAAILCGLFCECDGGQLPHLSKLHASGAVYSLPCRVREELPACLSKLLLVLFERNDGLGTYICRSCKLNAFTLEKSCTACKISPGEIIIH